MQTIPLFERYRELQSYVSWTDNDARRVEAIAPLLDPHLPSLIDDFYTQIERHGDALKVITGGPAQIERLKGRLLQWVRELLAGRYDESYVNQRWRVGLRHVEIGLNQVYTNAALCRLRTGLDRTLEENWVGSFAELRETVRSLDKLLDLDLAIIEEAYQAESQSRLQRAERLATLGQVAGGVAHELRNPLNVIRTSVYYLLHARTPTPEKMVEHLARIERQVELADGVITTLSNFARVPVPALGPTAVEPCVRLALEAYPPGPGIAVEVELPTLDSLALADPGQLRIVFGNLIRNACDAMEATGQLTIRGRQVGGTIAVAISDTGVGIPSADLQRIMEPLYSTKPRGLGLGLAIVRAILERSGADLHVESEPGRGSTFTVKLLASPSPRGEG